jgi:uncharacterized protein YqeY
VKLLEQIKEDLIKSMKAKDGNRVSVLRLLLSDINRREKDSKEDLTEEDVMALLQTAAKRRKESADAFREGEREDLASKEESELVILEEYLPEQMSADDIRAAVREVIEATGAQSPADMGKVMGQVMPKVKGKADGKLVNEVVRELLAG